MWICSGTPRGHAPLECRRRDRPAEQEGAAGARTRLSEALRREYTEREARVHELFREALGGGSASLDDQVESDLVGVTEAVAQ